MTSVHADLAAERQRAIASCLDDVRAILSDAGVNRAALERVKGRLLALAARRDLFSFAQFPLRHERSTMHLLAEDEDDGLALYAVAAQGESATPPHDHTTWAVVVGVEGAEMNRLWRRVDDGGNPGQAELERIEETLVAPGIGVALMPEDIHSIHRASDAPLLHFHLYGRSIERLPERKQFDLERGTYEVYPASPNNSEMSARIAAATLRARLTDGDGELALLDVHEQGAFARAHILLASNAPLSRLEIDVPRLVLRRATPVVLCDGGDGRAERAAAILARHGYSDLAVLDGGVDGWREAGFTLFEGIHVPSKAFGEFVEATCGTPHVMAEELVRLAAGGRKLVILDSRPLSEYRQMSIPGGIDVPGAELVHRVRDLAPDPETLVVVNCAGRTRSIIGAQSLINAGVENRVVALANGTMGWTLAGQRLEHGQARVPPPLTATARTWAQAAAARVGARFGVHTIGYDELARWREEAEARTLYLCDVRLPEEYEAGHLPGARCTPGGQLVQATDGYLGTRGGRIVLVDDDGVRATMTASWLLQMGWRETYVLQGGLGGALERGPERLEVLGLDDRPIERAVDPITLARMAESDAVCILDFADSRTFREGHIAGAWWLGRTSLQEDLPAIPPAPCYALTSPDGVLARLALADVRGLVGAPVQVLAGGTEAWRAAGLPLQAGADRMAGNPDDVVYLRPYDRPPEQAEAAMREYLQWEITLLSQLERDGTLSFPSYR